MKILHSKSSFRKEFKRQLRMAIVAAVGFTVAFSWRSTILTASEKFVNSLISLSSKTQVQTLSSIAITLVGVIIIWITSRILRD